MNKAPKIHTYLQNTDVVVTEEKNKNLLCSKVITWLGNTTDSNDYLSNFQDILADNVITTNSEEENDTSSHSSELLITALKTHVLTSDAFVANVPWEIENCDMFLQVEKVLFPIERAFVAHVSGFFRKMLEPIEKNKIITIVVLRGFSVGEVRIVLKSIYFVPQDEIIDSNLATMLQLAEHFDVNHLYKQCEHYLLNSKTFNAIIGMQLAKRFRLLKVLHVYCCRFSKIENFELNAQFKCLDFEMQNIVMKYAMKRLRNVKKSLSHLDTYLCSHHNNPNSINNSCCFRAATYEIVGDRKFLVNKEQPACNILKIYKEAFNVTPKPDMKLLKFLDDYKL